MVESATLGNVSRGGGPKTTAGCPEHAAKIHRNNDTAMIPAAPAPIRVPARLHVILAAAEAKGVHTPPTTILCCRRP